MAALAAQGFLPAEGADIDFSPVDIPGKCCRCRIADGEAGAVAGDPVGVWNELLVPFQVKMMSLARSIAVRSGSAHNRQCAHRHRASIA